jgi:hypothetical protein
MLTIAAMSDLSQSDKLSSRSLPSIVNALDALTTQLRAEGWKYRGSRVTKEAVHNTAVLYFLSLPLEQQRVILAERIAQLETAVGSDPSSQPFAVTKPTNAARLIARRVKTPGKSQTKTETETKPSGAKAKQDG